MNNAIAEQNAPSSAVSPIAGSVQAVLDLFEAELSDLKFPDLDLSVLQEAAAIVYERAESQARAEAALLAAREALQESQEALLHRCQRAMAYARVYAEDNSDLAARVEGIELPRAGRSRSSVTQNTTGTEQRPAARRTKRTTPTSGPLFLAPPESQETPAPTDQAA